jgi:hypothetical protein
MGICGTEGEDAHAFANATNRACEPAPRSWVGRNDA